MPGGRGTSRAVRVVTALLVLFVATGCGDDGEGSSATTTTTAPATTAPPVTAVPCGGRATEAYATHSGIDPNLTSLDVYRPADLQGGCTGRPLVVWVHGGAWTGGDKTDHIDDKVRLFTDAGYVFASVNYRLTDNTLDQPAPQHPVHDQDTADALAWLVGNAEAYGVDTDRVAVLGHSAGGGIVAALTTDGTYLGRHDLGLDAVRCAGSIDGEGYDVTVGATHPDPFVYDVYLDAFGSDPAVWEQASPMAHVAAGTGIPQYFVAVRGPEVRLDLHVEFVTALEVAGVPVTVLDARDLDHAEVSVEIGAPGDTVMTPAVMDFLAGCFAPT